MLALFQSAIPQTWEQSDFALVLGTDEEGCLARARIAAEYYGLGRTRKMILCGGVKRNGVRECDILREELLRLGVPESALLCEGESRDTMENFLFAMRVASLEGLLLPARNVAIVTEPYHALRSLLMGKRLLPFFLHPFVVSESAEEEARAHPERYESEWAILSAIAEMFSLPMQEMIP